VTRNELKEVKKLRSAHIPTFSMKEKTLMQMKDTMNKTMQTGESKSSQNLNTSHILDDN
jgi:hypothetical protein